MDSKDSNITAVQSDGQPQGFLDKLRANTPDILTNNAPRVVSALKIMGSTSMLFSKNRAFSLAGAGFITANIIMGLFGGKKTEEQKELLRKEEEEKQPESQNPVIRHLYKVFHPKKYPIESGASIATVASTSWTISGIFGKGGFSPGRLIGGLFSLASDANVAFKKEHIGETGANPHEKGSKDYYITEMKNRPVLFSSMLNIACDVASIIGGAHEKFWKGKEANTLIAGLFLLSANVFQAIFVNKNDYNIERKSAVPEKSAEIKNAKPLPESKKQIAWQDKIEAQALQPAYQAR